MYESKLVRRIKKIMCMDISDQNKRNGKYYGYEAQSNQLIEECAELIQAVNKYRRAVAREGAFVEKQKKRALDNLVEEMVDVEIMLEQIKYLLQIPEEDMLAVKIYKVNRTKERIEAKKNEKLSKFSSLLGLYSLSKKIAKE